MTGIGVWHVRKLSNAGLKPGGGIDTPTLCETVQPTGAVVPGRSYKGGGGWDLNVPITWARLNQKTSCCLSCQKVLVEAIRGK